MSVLGQKGEVARMHRAIRATVISYCMPPDTEMVEADNLPAEFSGESISLGVYLGRDPLPQES